MKFELLTCAQLGVRPVEALASLLTPDPVSTLATGAESLRLVLGPGPAVRKAVTHLGGAQALACRS